jgi:oleate hydratase
MKAHIVGGGFGGLAAAAYLIRNADVSGQDITVYEADDRMGGSFSLGGDAQSGYILPCGAVFDSEFHCTFDLLGKIPSKSNPSKSVKEEFFTFNAEHPFQDRVHIIDRNGPILHGPHFGLSLGDGFDLARLSLTPESMLDGRRIEEFFSAKFFTTEFWLLWSTIMGSLPQHGATEFRRYINRALLLFPDLSDMTGILRTPSNQYEAFIEPLVAWLQAPPRGVNLLTGTFVRDIGLAPSTDRITVSRLDYERGGEAVSVAVGPEDIVLVTTGSEAADLAVGSMSKPPQPPRRSGGSWELWKRLAQGGTNFGNPDVFFGAPRIPDSRWVTFTITMKGTDFVEQLSLLTDSKAGSGGLVTLKDSPWMLSLSILYYPEVTGQPPGTSLCWGYGLHPEQTGEFVQKRMYECTGAEILQEVLRQLRFDKQFDAIMASSICIPCDLPYVNNVWMPRKRTDRPRPVPQGATNLGLIGQYVEVSREVAFTIEYSARTAWEAIRILLRRGPPPPPVYQGQYDPKALFNALKVFICQ